MHEISTGWSSCLTHRQRRDLAAQLMWKIWYFEIGLHVSDIESADCNAVAGPQEAGILLRLPWHLLLPKGNATRLHKIRRRDCLDDRECLINDESTL